MSWMSVLSREGAGGTAIGRDYPVDRPGTGNGTPKSLDSPADVPTIVTARPGSPPGKECQPRLHRDPQPVSRRWSD